MFLFGTIMSFVNQLIEVLTSGGRADAVINFIIQFMNNLR